MNITFNGIWRMDWGFGNPNITAAFIASLLIFVWLPAFLFRKGFWFSLPLSTALGICLIHTISRGGILGGMIGLAVLVFFAPRPWPKNRLLAALACFWIAVIGVFFLKAHERMGQGIVQEDKSISHRLAIWKQTPAMLYANPAGWGWNQSGEAYMDWFQPVDRKEYYGSLVNTHLSKLVELGLFGGAAYLFIWGVALLLCWPSHHMKWRAVLFATLVAFGVAASFTNMAREPLVWIIPALCLLIAVVSRLLRRNSPDLPLVGSLAFASIIFSLGLFLIGSRADSHIRSSQGALIVGKGQPKTWILIPSEIPGHTVQKAVRQHLADQSYENAIAIVSDARKLPDPVSAPILIVGKISPEDRAIALQRCKDSVTFVSPDFHPKDLTDATRAKAVYGEFSNSPYAISWQDAGRCVRLEGLADFIPDWKRDILERFVQKSPEPGI